MTDLSIAVDQVWESRDPRDNGRRVRVVALLDWFDSMPPKALVENTKTGRKSEVRFDRLPFSYRRVEDWDA